MLKASRFGLANDHVDTHLYGPIKLLAVISWPMPYQGFGCIANRADNFWISFVREDERNWLNLS
ncbi:hypothetical protein AJ87_18625 [Rhizobium yanglingense]|nr:hypothetical protein AJ87_18625 [Rhizobium yanglingense]